MSDDEKPAEITPLTTIRPERMRDEAFRLQESLRDTGAKLGLNIIVKHDPYNWCFRFFVKLPHESVTHDIDEEAFAYPAKGPGLADLVDNVLEHMQLTLHQKLAEQMGATNVRGRQFTLSKEDKSVLHDMFMDASLQRSQYHGGGQVRLEADKQKLDAYQALINRLFA